MPEPTTPGAATVSDEVMVINEDVARKLMQMIENTREIECSCEETFALLDEFVELVASNEEAAALMPIVQHHIDVCPDCRDKFEMLLRILQTG